MKPGTRIEVTVHGGPNEAGEIIKPRAENLPKPTPEYHLVQFDDDGGKLYIHEEEFRVVDNR